MNDKMTSLRSSDALRWRVSLQVISSCRREPVSFRYIEIKP
jgi:hypothetical protein